MITEQQKQARAWYARLLRGYICTVIDETRLLNDAAHGGIGDDAAIDAALWWGCKLTKAGGKHA